MSKIILAFETSCDETACALYCDKRGILGERVFSQWRRHAPYGGVVPELASREHLRQTLFLVDSLLGEVAVCPTHIAFTQGPGLAGALLAGATIANTLAMAWDIPTIAVNHLEGHLLSPLLDADDSIFPYIALLVSGGHTQLWAVGGRGQYRLLGETLDDACGEAFDKTAVLLGLGYPGGAALEKLAKKGDPHRFKLPSPAQADFCFSFSGLKSAVRRLLQTVAADSVTEFSAADSTADSVVAENAAVDSTADSIAGNAAADSATEFVAAGNTEDSVAAGNAAVDSVTDVAADGNTAADSTADSVAGNAENSVVADSKNAALADSVVADVAAAFQHCVAEGLAKQSRRALQKSGYLALAVVGGVAQNNAVAARLRQTANAFNAKFIRPPAKYCGDNAAMIALAAAHQPATKKRQFTVSPQWTPQ